MTQTNNNLIGIGITTVSNQQSPQVELLHAEYRKIKHHQPYGLSTHPIKESQAIVLFPSGDRGNGIAIQVGDANYQIQLKEGEVCLHDNNNQTIKLGQDGITIDSSQPITINAQTATLQASQTTIIGETTIEGNLTCTGKVQATAMQTGTIAAGSYAGSGGGAVTTDSQIISTQDIQAQGVSLANHTHPFTGDEGFSGTTQKPS